MKIKTVKYSPGQSHYDIPEGAEFLGTSTDQSGEVTIAMQYVEGAPSRKRRIIGAFDGYDVDANRYEFLGLIVYASTVEIVLFIER